MIRIFLSVLLFCPALPAFAQDNFNERKMVGFACFYEGRETKLVSRFGRMLTLKRYDHIRRLLHSGNSAERLMSVLCLERLNAVGRLTLTTKEKEQINQIKTSAEPVAICSGCFPDPGMPLRQVFESEILGSKARWLEKHIKD